MSAAIKIGLVIATGLGFVSCVPPTPQGSNENLPPLSSRAPKNVNENSNLSATPAPTVSEAVKTSETANNSAKIRAEANTNESLNATVSAGANTRLIIPVAGVRPEELHDTFQDARSEGRVHDAIDIMAREDTPVIAAADGEIARFFYSERGGITIYQFSADRKLIYYYAHLKRRADDLQEHATIKQGRVIGYVGDTGNAGTGNFHLHFAIWQITDPQRYWDGININPYPLLR